jgi:hypothetical protein
MSPEPLRRSARSQWVNGAGGEWCKRPASPVSAFHGDSRLRHPVMSTLLVKSMKHAPTMGTTR